MHFNSVFRSRLGTFTRGNNLVLKPTVSGHYAFLLGIFRQEGSTGSGIHASSLFRLCGTISGL